MSLHGRTNSESNRIGAAVDTELEGLEQEFSNFVTLSIAEEQKVQKVAQRDCLHVGERTEGCALRFRSNCVICCSSGWYGIVADMADELMEIIEDLPCPEK